MSDSEAEQPIEPDPTHVTRWCTDHNFNPFADSYHDVSCFVTDLFDRRDFDYPDCALVSTSDPIAAAAGDDDDDLESNFDSRLGFEAATAAESNSQASGSEFDVFLAPQGLHVAGLDSENDDDSNRVSEGIQSIWDSIFMEEEERPIDAYETSEWEEDDNVVAAPPQPEEVSVTSGFTIEEEDDVPDDGALRSIQWEILLTVNNFPRNVDDAVELDVETAEYIEAIFDRFVDNASACKGSPPAALRVVEDLPILKFTELSEDEVLCAVCKDEIASEDKVRSLPCCHYYHHDCIVPWLSMRNTCPVCRYELPTDDVEYEMSKRERAARGLSWGSQVRERFI